MKINDLFKVRGPAEPTRFTSPAAETLGRNDWMNRMPHNTGAFKTLELQSEYDAGYEREVRDARDAAGR